MFDKILIANRGEIACRVIETARRMGIRTVAVYSDADAAARHVAMADEAVHLGPPPARESYLLGDRILEAAADTGAEAIHPGYGFLSENAGFADACEKAGIVFIGPPASAIRAMGSKAEAKALMGKAGVPLTPGYHGEDQDEATLKAAADNIGYPVLIKASAGGGGKGMRLVEKAADFADALASCRREAASSFGDDRVLVERFVTRPRHIEMQVFADSHGNAVHLFERDCSIQRRHQKVLEEAPAPGMPEDLRARMGEAAVNAAKAVGYRGAGTVEFIAESRPDGTPGDFFFMEMNTRLQVEHPVTEAVTGYDLVEWQLRVASGEPLPAGQDGIAATGHAIEARLYAENPEAGFLPSTGRLECFRTPAAGARIDTGVRDGDEISPFYDPMIAKVIAHGADREEARRRLIAALAETHVAGISSNRDFLIRVLKAGDFAAAKLDTGFIEKHERDLLPERAPASDVMIAAAALIHLTRIERDAAARRADSGDPTSPWAQARGWRMLDRGRITFDIGDDGAVRSIAAHALDDGWEISIDDGEPLVAEGIGVTEDAVSARIAGRAVRPGWAAYDSAGTEQIVLFDANSTIRLSLIDPLAGAAGGDGPDHSLTAPMPGKVMSVSVAPGDAVVSGQALLVLEAMKMEHTIRAPEDGVVATLPFAVGDQVSEGAVPITFEEAGAE